MDLVVFVAAMRPTSEVLDAALQLGIWLLWGGNPAVQERFVEVLAEHDFANCSRCKTKNDFTNHLCFWAM